MKEATVAFTEAEELLKALAHAFISTCQSTYGWSKELEDALN